jgi:endonuclease YncB( thermonuclease family)
MTSAVHPDGKWEFDVLFVLSVHDGDTVKICADRGGSDWWPFWLRLAGIYAPELSEPGGYEARDWLESFLHQISPPTWKMATITHRVVKSDNDKKSLDRLVGELFVGYGTENQIDVGQLVIDTGHATPVPLGLEPW